MKFKVATCVFILSFCMAISTAHGQSLKNNVAFNAAYSKLDLGWDSGWYPPGDADPGASTIQVRLRYDAAAKVNANVIGDYFVALNQLSPGFGSGSWDYDLGADVQMQIAFNINFTIPNPLPWGDDFTVQPFIIDIPFTPNFNLLANNSTTFNTYLLDSISSLSDTTDPVTVYDLDLLDLIVDGLNWPSWTKTLLNAGASLKASFQVDGALTCDNMTASDGNVFTSEFQPLPIDMSSNPYQANLTYNENFDWNVVIHATPAVFLSILGARWEYPVLDIPWQVYQGPLDLEFSQDNLVMDVGGEGEGEGECGGEGEGEGETCPVACASTCDGGPIQAGTAAALTAIFGTDAFAHDPLSTDLDANGLPDVTQLQLLDLILVNPGLAVHCCVRASWGANAAVVEGYLAQADASLFTVLPQATFLAAFTGLATCGERATLNVLVDLLAPYGVTVCTNTFDRGAEQYLASDGDADLDGVCNFAEYNAVSGSAEGFVIAAIDPAITQNGGGCFAPCFTEVIPGDDTTPPLITLLGEDPTTAECGMIYVDAGATALDNVDGDLTTHIAVTGTVDTAVPGEYSLTYTVSDAAGNAAIPVTRTIHVADTAAPELLLLGEAEVTIECGDTYNDEGTIAVDACEGDLTAAIQVSGVFDPTEPGDYLLTANVSDSAGNAAIPVTRTIHVLDTTPPVLQLLGEAVVTLECGTAYTDAGAYATDTCAGDLGAAIQGSSNLNTARAGEYQVSFSVSDPSGNAAVPVTRTIIVTCSLHKADTNMDNVIDLSELLRVIQFFNSGGYHCDAAGEDGYAPGSAGDTSCAPHSADYNPVDWNIDLSELLRVIQLFNSGGYHPCAEGEDGFCPGMAR